MFATEHVSCLPAIAVAVGHSEKKPMSQPKSSRSDAASGKERRQFTRRSSIGSALLRPTNQATTSAVRVSVVDFSYGGVCFIAPVKLSIGDHVLLDMPSSKQVNWSVTLEAVVQWVDNKDSKDNVAGFRTGGAWIRQLSYLELQQLG